MNDILSYLTTINPWGKGEITGNGLIRELYLDKIANATGNRLIKVIVGQRRAGKSYIVRQIINQLIITEKVPPVNIFYLNKELYEFDEIRNAGDLQEVIQLYRKHLKPKGKVYLFIDEVQNIEAWEKIIVSLAQHPVEEYEIFITGSNSGLLSGELATRLSGRYVVFEVFPFSYHEYLAFNHLDDSKEHFINYLETTGMPEALNIASYEIRQHYFQSLKDTVLLRDIMFRHKIRDYVLLEDLFLFLLHNTGNLVSVPSIIKYFKSKNRKVEYATVASYIKNMEDAFIIRRCPKYSVKTKELLSGDKKYFVNDLGFRNYIYPQLRTEIGSMLENVVYLHLKMAGYDVKVGYLKNMEVDFVAEKGDRKFYVQVAYLLSSQATIDREFRSLEAIPDSFPKYVVSMDDLTIRHPKGIFHENIRNFISIIGKP